MLLCPLRDYTMGECIFPTLYFFVALSLIGVLMSAVLKLTNFEWYRPLSRIAEVIAVAAILLAGEYCRSNGSSWPAALPLVARKDTVTDCMGYHCDCNLHCDQYCVVVYSADPITFLPVRIICTINPKWQNENVWMAFLWMGRDTWTMEDIEAQYSHSHNHGNSGWSIYTYCDCLVVCNNIACRMGQHKFWSLFCFRSIFIRCCRNDCCGVCNSQSIQTGTLSDADAFW